MDAVVIAMIAALLAAVLASVFDQRREGSKTRDAIADLSSQVAALTATSAVHGQQLASLQQSIGQVHQSLGNARERLARIEGRLEISDGDGGIFEPPPEL